MSIGDFTLIIPLIACIILFVFFRKSVCWWEYLVLIIPSIILTIGLRMVMVSYNTSANEYWGNHIVAVTHYDHWNEWISQTCSYQSCTGSGKDQTCTTIYYDCSYCKDHPEYWVKSTDDDKEVDISEYEYDKLAKQFHSNKDFVAMHRNYYTINGDAQQYDYLGDIQAVEPFVTEHSYVNKVKASSSLFKFDDITKKEIAEWKLYSYPEVTDNHQNTVIGIQQPYLFVQRKFDYINGVFGPKHQVHLFILFYKNQPYDVVHKQLSYWYGGGKNELLVHIGIDSLTNKIMWYDATSWMDKPEVTARIKTYLAGKTKIDLNNFADFLLPTIDKYWQRKHFKDFNYLHIELTVSELIWLILLIFIYNAIISIWIIRNNYTAENPKGYSRKSYY